jgi:hypothetical protein
MMKKSGTIGTPRKLPEMSLRQKEGAQPHGYTYRPAKKCKNPVFQKVSEPLRYELTQGRIHCNRAKKPSPKPLCSDFLYRLLLEENPVTLSEIDAKNRHPGFPAFKMTMLQIKSPL